MAIPTHADRPRAEAIVAHAMWAGADRDLAEQAAARVVSGELLLLGVTGWMASGKDTIAPAVMAELGVDVGSDQVVHTFYAKKLKEEVDDLILPLLRTASSPAGATAELADAAGVSDDQARRVVDLMWDDTRPDRPEVSAFDRTGAVRTQLQFWGTDVRRAADPDYWVKLALQPIVGHLAAGRHVYFTDVRFPNEVSGSQKLGFHVVRLQVSRATQKARIAARDPHVDVSSDEFQAAIRHPSETALDGFDSFDQVIDNNGRPGPTVAKVAAALRARTSRAAAA